MISNFRRFLHWGPITALSIIKCITLTTLYMNSMWWPPNHSLGALVNQAFFLLLSTMATYNYVMATITGPGLLPKQWKPKNPEDTVHLQYCKICEGYKAPRSHHCRKCDRCIKKMDHHCPWINHCVGWANHAHFTYFLLFSILGSLHATVVLCCAFYRGIYRYYYLTYGLIHLATVQFTLYSIIACILAMALAIGVVIGLSMLLYIQFKTIVANQTGIELWIVEKALYRRFNNLGENDFVYPYDLGWKQNIKQVFNDQCQQRGEGIEWPVVEGCDQYTLTREQIAQKLEKRARTKTFVCTRRATGQWLPVFSQGFRVCFAVPCTDEPRIKLQPGDVIKVTRFRQHWLFGERVERDDCAANKDGSGDSKTKKYSTRGWFPRRCAIELTEAVSTESAKNDDGGGGDGNGASISGDDCKKDTKRNLNGHNHKQNNCKGKKYM